MSTALLMMGASPGHGGEPRPAADLPAAASPATSATGELSLTIGLPNSPRTILLKPGGGRPFSDCPAAEHCPSMVVVPGTRAGEVIGSPDAEAGRLASEQRHAISFGPFAIGRFEVSVAEYMSCAGDGGCRPPEWAEPGGLHNIETGSGVTYKAMARSISGQNQPVVGVSWNDAAQFAAWLSHKTGHSYRLASEAEWEHAARAGTDTAYWWGNDVTLDRKVMACCQGCGSEMDGKGLYPVESFSPNAWGLYNVHGNVWEWVSDLYCEDYASAPSDGSPRTEPKCGKQESPEGLRVFRGGSCFYGPVQMRSSMRLRNVPDFRNQTLGFRIARDLAP